MVAIIALAVLCTGQTAALIWLVRKLIETGDKLSTERDNVSAAESKRAQCEQQYQVTSREFTAFVSRTKQKEQTLKDDIAQLEGDLAKCVAPGARKLRIERLLSKATDTSFASSKDDKSPARVPPDGEGTGGAGI